jgi:hypothetical protein
MTGTFIASEAAGLEEHKNDPFAVGELSEPHSPYDFPISIAIATIRRVAIPRRTNTLADPADLPRSQRCGRGIIAAYYVSGFLDRNVGLFTKLRDFQLEHDTLVVYMADRQHSLGQHGASKALLPDPALRVPLIMLPGRIKRGVVHDFTESVDVVADDSRSAWGRAFAGYAWAQSAALFGGSRPASPRNPYLQPISGERRSLLARRAPQVHPLLETQANRRYEIIIHAWPLHPAVRCDGIPASSPTLRERAGGGRAAAS